MDINHVAFLCVNGDGSVSISVFQTAQSIAFFFSVCLVQISNNREVSSVAAAVLEHLQSALEVNVTCYMCFACTFGHERVNSQVVQNEIIQHLGSHRLSVSVGCPCHCGGTVYRIKWM